MHKLIHSDAKPFRCSICPKSFRQSGHIIAHTCTHSGVGPYQCQECGYKFTTGSVLNRHFNFIHFKIPRKKEAHQCNKCGNISVSLGSLMAYMRTHSGSRPYQCEECRYKFTTGSVLNRHINFIHFKIPLKKEARLLSSLITVFTLYLIHTHKLKPPA